MTSTLVWFRQDLRLQDNSALDAAIARGGAVVPVFIVEENERDRWRPGAASRWWLHHSLGALDASLRERGSQLVLAQGAAGEVLRELTAATGAGAVYWNRRYEPAHVATDRAVEAELTTAGIEVKHFNSALLFEPTSITNKQGNPFQVFTPFWRHCLAQPIADSVKQTAKTFVAPKKWPRSLKLDALTLRPAVPWDGGLRHTWEPGEAGAMRRLKAFLRDAVAGYAEQRDRPAVDGTSRLSPWLHFGEIGPRQVWAAVRDLGRESGLFPPNNGARVFLSELGWREFAYHQLFHFPQMTTHAWRKEFERFPWADDESGGRLRAWQRGRTGYPIVDAGMRQLERTGWMHNRVRMIVASFLVKHLRLPWQDGAAWFWDTLVDADLANNTLGWQWSAGCGADAAPYFRIFAPVLQGRKFDADGDYVRRWVPELARMPAEHVHAPWTAPVKVLAAAGVTLGETYPRPIVDHARARAEALQAWQAMRARPSG